MSQTTTPRLLEQRHGITFAECLELCIGQPDLIAQWDASKEYIAW
jgi:hypothetical protein